MDRGALNALEVRPLKSGWYWVTMYQYKKEDQEDPDYIREWVEFTDGKWDYGYYDGCYVCFIHSTGARVMYDIIEHCMYESGLTADGCWNELDDYAKDAIERFARLLVQELADQGQELGME